MPQKVALFKKGRPIATGGGVQKMFELKVKELDHSDIGKKKKFFWN